MNDTEPDPTATTEGKPMTKTDLEWSRVRFGRWMDEPERRAKREGWSHDHFDDCC